VESQLPRLPVVKALVPTLEEEEEEEEELHHPLRYRQFRVEEVLRW
jgi:hypothetical protein